jgi:4-diphosphocytidyl-2-C-methyl-D-erythritol kinase
MQFMTDPQRSCRKDYAATCGATPGRTTQPLILSSPAKLNIFLEVLGKRSDGYHELETIMVRTRFCDQLTFERTNSADITMRVSDATSAEMRATMPLDESNLVVKSALALQRATGASFGAHIILHKRVPPESGLGGGSSNAATTLLGCRQLWNVDISDAQMHSIAAELFFVALRPRTGNSTPAVFRQTKIPTEPRSSAELVDAISKGTRSVSPLIFNRLTDAASKLNPEMETLLKRIPQVIRRPAFMSGSGSTVYVVAAGRRDAKEVADQLKQAFHLPVWLLECGVDRRLNPQSI